MPPWSVTKLRGISGAKPVCPLHCLIAGMLLEHGVADDPLPSGLDRYELVGSKNIVIGLASQTPAGSVYEGTSTVYLRYLPPTRYLGMHCTFEGTELEFEVILLKFEEKYWKIYTRSRANHPTKPRKHLWQLHENRRASADPLPEG